jgi:hypothetical protein
MGLRGTQLTGSISYTLVSKLASFDGKLVHLLPWLAFVIEMM